MQLSGWNVVLDGDGVYVAKRIAEVSEYQAEQGVIAEVSARDADELVILAAAQAVLRATVARAEAIHLVRRARRDAGRAGRG